MIHSSLSVDRHECPPFWRMIWITLPLKLKLSFSRCWILQKFHCTSQLQKIKGVQYVLSLMKLNKGYGYQIEIEKRRWKVLVIQWRQWEKCSKERVNMTKPTLLWAGDSCLTCTLSIRRVIGISRVAHLHKWYPLTILIINLCLHKDQRLDNVLSVKKGTVFVKFGHPER